VRPRTAFKPQSVVKKDTGHDPPVSFLFPWAFAALGLVPVIVVLYLLKVRRTPLTVSTLLFWRRILEEKKRRALFQRLRNLLSLLLHLLIFLLILLALARPELKRFLLSGASTVLVIDARARMRASSDGKTRFELARELASSYARHASRLNEMAVVLAHRTAAVAAPFSSDDATLRTQIQTLDATDAGGELAPAVALARQLLGSRKGETRILLFTADPAAQFGGGVEVVPVGEPHDNVALTRFAARMLPNSPLTSQILIEVRNFGRTRSTGNVEIRLDDTLLDVRPYDLEPGGKLSSTFTAAPSAESIRRGWLTAQLDKADALPVDNTARALIPPLTPARVLLVTKGDWFLENLLKADDLVRFELLSPESFQPGMEKSFDVTILDDYLPDGFDLASTTGNILFLKRTPFGMAGEPLDQPLVTDTDAASPILRLVNLKNVVFLRAQAQQPPEPDDGWRFDVPIRSFDSPLVVTGERRSGGALQRIAAFGFGSGDSDLPLRVAFPLLISNTIEWLCGRADREPRSAIAGELVPIAADERVASIPALKLDETPVADTAGSFRPMRDGYYRLAQGGRDTWMAVNTFSDTESNLLAPVSAAAAPGTTASKRFTLASRPAVLLPLWIYLALAALLLFTLEWFLYHRRKTE
jgi:Aerotolerance regulator N-terminal/von Willebrand factor type A domain